MARTLGTEPLLHGLLQEHAEFHRRAGRVAELINRATRLRPGTSWHRPAPHRATKGAEPLSEVKRLGFEERCERSCRDRWLNTEWHGV